MSQILQTLQMLHTYREKKNRSIVEKRFSTFAKFISNKFLSKQHPHFKYGLFFTFSAETESPYAFRIVIKMQTLLPVCQEHSALEKQYLQSHKSLFLPVSDITADCITKECTVTAPEGWGGGGLAPILLSPDCLAARNQHFSLKHLAHVKATKHEKIYFARLFFFLTFFFLWKEQRVMETSMSLSIRIKSHLLSS